MRNIAALAMAAALALSGCTSTRQVADLTYQAPQKDYALAVMRPDVTVGLLTASGIVEPRADWTETARSNVLDAIEKHQAERGGAVQIVEVQPSNPQVAEIARELDRLHRAVGTTILIHKYAGAELPTKRDRFDWTLGETASKLAAATGADYALFMRAEDSFSSGGRQALQVLGLAGCIIGFCAPVGGGQRLAFASLVDLKTGQIVWFNVLSSQIGDLRTPEGAAETVSDLLEEMPAGGAKS